MGIPLSMIELKSLILGERLADGFLMYRDAYDTTPPLTSFIYKYIDLLFGKSRFAHHFISTIWIFVNATILNFILIRARAYKENNYLPALFFVMLSFVIPDYMALTPQIMSTTFIMLAFNSVIRRIGNEVTDVLFLYAGLYLGVASLLYTPAIIFFGVFLVSFVLFSTPIKRRILLYLYGFLIPILIVGAYFLWFDSHIYFINSVFLSGFQDDRILHLVLAKWWPFITILIFWVVVSLYNILNKGWYTNFETKISQVMFFYLIAGFGIIWIDNMFSPTQLIIFIPPFAYFLTHYILLLKKRFISFIIPVLMVGSLCIFPFFIYNFLDKSSLVVPKNTLPYVNKKIMLLSDDFSLFHEQKIAGPVLAGRLSQRNLLGIDDYQSATRIYESIARNLPEIIIDDWNMMDKIFFRFPLLEEKYRAGSNNKYYLKLNN